MLKLKCIDGSKYIFNLGRPFLNKIFLNIAIFVYSTLFLQEIEIPIGTLPGRDGVGHGAVDVFYFYNS